MFDKDRSISKVSNRSTLPAQIKSKIDHYSDEITRLQKENISINTENQILSSKFTELVVFNQELGNDLACFDQDIENLEMRVTEKSLKYKRLCKESESLHKEFENYRKIIQEGGNNSDLLKRLEKRKKQLIRNFQDLNSDKVDVDSYDILKVRASITSQIREIDEQNKELLFQIDILKTLLNEKYSATEKRNLLNNALSQKKVNRESIEKQIQDLKNKENQNVADDDKMSEKNEFADDEDMDLIQFSSQQQNAKTIPKISKNHSAEQLLHSTSEINHHSTSNKFKIVKPLQNDNDLLITYNKNTNKDPNSRQLQSLSKSFHSDNRQTHHHHLSKKSNSESIRKNDVLSLKKDNHNQEDSSSSSTFSFDQKSKNKLKSLNGSNNQQFHQPTKKDGNQSNDKQIIRRKKKVKKSNDEYDYEYEFDGKTVNLAKAEVQVNESDFNDGQKDPEESKMDQLEQQNRDLLKELKSQLAEKQKEKEKIELEIHNSETKLTVQSKVNCFTIYTDPLKHITQSKWRLSVSNQTDLTGTTIDFHLKILKNQEMERQTSATTQSDIEDLKQKIKEHTEKIEAAKLESERRDIAISQVQQELNEVQTRIEGDKTYQTTKKRMKIEFSTDIKKLKTEIRNKQALLQSTTEENARANEKLDELIHKKNELEHEIEELAFKEKPQIEDLSEKVQSFQQRVEESKLRLLKAQEELEIKREELESVRNSDEYLNYKELILRKKTLERRITKWKMLLKDSSETLQSLEQFSADNIEKRKGLKNMVKKYEGLKFDKEEEYSDTEQYSMLLESMLTEQKNNWC